MNRTLVQRVTIAVVAVAMLTVSVVACENEDCEDQSMPMRGAVLVASVAADEGGTELFAKPKPKFGSDCDD